MANPRKFSEKIALHNQKQAEETAAFEAIMRDVTPVTKVCYYSRLKRLIGSILIMSTSNESCFVNMKLIFAVIYLYVGPVDAKAASSTPTKHKYTVQSRVLTKCQPDGGKFRYRSTGEIFTMLT